MILMRQLFRFFDLVCEETTPNRVAAGLVVGFFLGAYPLLSVAVVLLLFVSVVVRVQLPAVLIGLVLGELFGTFLDPLFDPIGLFFLKSATLRSTWAFLYHAPLVPFTRFNNTVMFGITLVSLVAGPLLYFLVSRLLGRHWGNIATRGMYTHLWVRWQSSFTCRLYREYQENSPGAKVPPRRDGLRRMIRTSSFPWVAGFAAVVLTIAWLSKEAVLRRQLEIYASRVNGAMVNIGAVELSPFSGTLVLKDVQIGNSVSPGRNLAQIRRVQMNFSLEPLVRKKIVFPRVVVDGVGLDTDRVESALLPESETSQGVAGILERSAPGYYADVRSALKTNPLKYLGSLSSGLSLNPRVDQLRTKLETLQAMEKQEREIETLSARWEAGKLNLPTAKWIHAVRQKLADITPADKEAALRELGRVRTEIASSIASVSDIAASFTESLGSVQRDIASLAPNLDSDVARVKEALKLPDFSMEDLSPQLFGGPVLGVMERIAYFIDLSRRRMPLGDVTEKMALVIKPAARGTDLFFANRSGSPEVLILSIDFVTDNRETDARLTGQAYGFTSEPSFFAQPAGATIEAHFPSQKIEKLKFTMVIDHTAARFKEDIAIQAAMVPLNHLSLHDTSGLSLAIEKATLAFQLAARFDGDNVKAQWNAQIDDVQYLITSRFLPEEAAMKRILTPVQSISLSGGAEGPKEQMHLSIQSNVGKILSAGLRQEFRHALGAVDDNIRRSILDKAEPTRRALASRLSQLRQGALQTVNRSLKDLQDLAAEADTLRGRLEQPKGKTTAERVRPRK